MDKKQIEAEIKAKKEEIKQANRELSKLQDELKKETEPLTVSFKEVRRHYSDLIEYWVLFTANREIGDSKIRSFIESLSDPVEPKSYVDWDKIPKEYNWVAIDKSCCVYAYLYKPYIAGDHWFLGYGTIRLDAIIPDYNWINSLIHRPGVKE